MNKIQVGVINGVPVFAGNPDYIRQGEYYLDGKTLKTREDLGDATIFKETTNESEDADSETETASILND